MSLFQKLLVTSKMDHKDLIYSLRLNSSFIYSFIKTYNRTVMGLVDEVILSVIISSSAFIIVFSKNGEKSFTLDAVLD